MLSGNVADSNLKRRAVDLYASVKKIKTEEKTEDLHQCETSLQDTIKPPTRGVERIHPYPFECRPSQPYFEWHRRQLVKDVTEKLSLRGMRIIGLPKFLDDGIVFDWILDKSLIPKNAGSTAGRSGGLPSLEIVGTSEEVDVRSLVGRESGDHAVKSCGSDAQSLAALKDFQGSLDDPIFITDSDHECPNMTLEGEDFAEQKLTPAKDAKELQGPQTIGDELSDDSERDNSSEMVSDSESSSEGNELSPLLEITAQMNPQEAPYAPTVPSLRGRVNKLRDPEVGTNAAGTHNTIPEHVSTLKDVNWDNYRSIIVVKGLKGGAQMEDIYAFLLNHGINFQSVKHVLMHHRDKSGDIMPFIEFFTPALAQEAMVKLQDATWQISAPAGSRPTLRPKAEPCQRPKWYLTNINQPASNRQPPQIRHSNKADSQLQHDSQRRDVSRAPSRRGGSIALPRSYNSPLPDTVSSKRLKDNTGGKRPEEAIEIDDSSAVEDDASSRGSLQRQSRDGRTSSASDSDSSPTSGSDSNSEDNVGYRTVSEDDEGEENESSRATRQHHVQMGAIDDENIRSQSVAVERRTRLATVILPKVPYGRPRRILLPRNNNAPIASVSMRGDFQFIDSRTKSRIHTMSVPASENSKGRVEDACMLGETGIAGFSGDGDQLVFVAFNEAGNKAIIRPSTRKAHDKRGISCLGPIEAPGNGRSFDFLSGGFDKFVRRWHVTSVADLDDGPPIYSVTIQRLSQEHNSTITSVAWHGYDSTVLSAAGAKLWTTHAERKTVLGAPSVVSNLINHIHTHPSNPHIVILEVAHPYTQVQVFDIRQGYSGAPIISLGYADTSLSATGIRARHRKGDTTIKHFVRGHDDGTVALWDYRNTKTTLKVHQMQEPVYHTVFTTRKSTDIWAFAGNQLDFIS